jgi:DNA-directed RNA polymerase I, II, and III subunit RPABC2
MKTTLLLPLEKHLNTTKITTKYLTKYEKTRLLSIRALQIANNSEIFTSIDDSIHNSLDIAKKEFEEKIYFPIAIQRRLPSGKIETFRLEEMTVVNHG